MKRITKVHNAMQHTLSNLLCCYSWPAVTGEPNKGKRSREATSISFRSVPFGCFRHFWISDCMSHVWKCRSYNSDFHASQGQILSPRRKLSRKTEREKKEKKSECCATKCKSQCSQGTSSQGSFQNAWLSQFAWLMFDRESQIYGVCVCVCVCGFAKNRFSKSISFKMSWRGWKYPLKCQNRGECTL